MQPFIIFIKVTKVTAGPQSGRTTLSLAPVRPLWGRWERVSAIRRFHSLRSFHQRLFTFAPFGDGRMRLAKLELHDETKFFLMQNEIEPK